MIAFVVVVVVIGVVVVYRSLRRARRSFSLSSMVSFMRMSTCEGWW